jgi:hypothetical protein
VATKTELKAAEALHGEKMIELRIRFWTNGIAEEKGKIIPKHAWSGGMVRMEPNKAHGITSGEPVPFNSLMELTAVIEDVVIKNGIVLYPSNKTYRYLKGQR